MNTFASSLCEQHQTLCAFFCVRIISLKQGSQGSVEDLLCSRIQQPPIAATKCIIKQHLGIWQDSAGRVQAVTPTTLSPRLPGYQCQGPNKSKKICWIWHRAPASQDIAISHWWYIHVTIGWKWIAFVCALVDWNKRGTDQCNQACKLVHSCIQDATQSQPRLGGSRWRHASNNILTKSCVLSFTVERHFGFNVAATTHKFPEVNNAKNTWYVRIGHGLLHWTWVHHVQSLFQLSSAKPLSVNRSM